MTPQEKKTADQWSVVFLHYEEIVHTVLTMGGSAGVRRRGARFSALRQPLLSTFPQAALFYSRPGIFSPPVRLFMELLMASSA